jgi:hypothetical protein
MIKVGSKMSSLLLATMVLAKLASAQGLPWLDDPPPHTALAETAAPEQTPILKTMAPQVATTTAPSTVTIPAGTRVLMVLKSPLHTTSGTAGSVFILKLSIPWCKATA